MNCFVIMPFSPEFDDVYAAIKSTVESVSPEVEGRCFRLDESRPAGRITDRLLAELTSATVCIADLTETRPNVMWEVGYAMALQKPVLVITQDLRALPFDLKDMQGIEYTRSRLTHTLGAPLRRMLLDTLSYHPRSDISREGAGNGLTAEHFGSLLAEVAQLRNIVGEAVQAWRSGDPVNGQGGARRDSSLVALVGDWLSDHSGSHIYSRLVHGELVSPYCYGGDTALTGIYYGWKQIGEYWFARFKWLGADPSGFAFMRQESPERLSGAWWSSQYEVRGSSRPPETVGVSSTWFRRRGAAEPLWVKNFFEELEMEGLASIFARYA